VVGLLSLVLLMRGPAGIVETMPVLTSVELGWAELVKALEASGWWGQ
jgi:hypothetical protein